MHIAPAHAAALHKLHPSIHQIHAQTCPFAFWSSMRSMHTAHMRGGRHSVGRPGSRPLARRRAGRKRADVAVQVCGVCRSRLEVLSGPGRGASTPRAGGEGGGSGKTPVKGFAAFVKVVSIPSPLLPVPPHSSQTLSTPICCLTALPHLAPPKEQSCLASVHIHSIREILVARMIHHLRSRCSWSNVCVDTCGLAPGHVSENGEMNSL